MGGNIRRGWLAVGIGLTMAGLLATTAAAQTHRNDRPDAGPPLIEPAGSRPSAAAAPPRAGTRAIDSTRTPMPDREALPPDMQDIPLAPPTPPIPQDNGSGSKTGGGADRVKEIFSHPAPTPPQPRDSVTRTPEDQLAPATPPR